MKSSLSFAKVWFVLSIATLAFGYGYASHAWDLFPKTYVQRAWGQTQYLFGAGHRATKDEVFDRYGVRSPSPDEMQPGLTLITSMWREKGEWRPGLRLIDSDGEVLHRWQVDPQKLFESGYRKDPTQADIHGSLLLEDGDVVVNLVYVGTARLDACGSAEWTLGEGGHHSISQEEDGSLWISAVSSEMRSRTENFPSGFPGLEKPVWVDRALHVSGKGEILDDISILDLVYENDLERYFAKFGSVEGDFSSMGGDITHINDIEPLTSEMSDEYPAFKKGDLLLSMHHMHTVLVFNPDSKRVKWNTEDDLIGQHDPDFIGEGWIGIFDNNKDQSGGKMLGGSRIVAVQPHTDSTKILFSAEKLDRFYTDSRGKWQMLENGNMLLTESGAGRVVEVSPDGDLVWEWIQEPHDSKIPSATKATRVDLTREEVASWPCSSVDSVSTSSRKQQTAR